MGRGDGAVGEEAIETLSNDFIYDLGCLQGQQGRAEKLLGRHPEVSAGWWPRLLGGSLCRQSGLGGGADGHSACQVPGTAPRRAGWRAGIWAGPHLTYRMSRSRRGEGGRWKGRGALNPSGTRVQ